MPTAKAAGLGPHGRSGPKAGDAAEPIAVTWSGLM